MAQPIPSFIAQASGLRGDRVYLTGPGTPLAPGLRACAVCQVHTGTGQATAVTALPPVQVLL